MSNQKQAFDDANLRKSTADSRSWINNNGDKVTSVGKNHSIVNGNHVYGSTAITNAVKKLGEK